MSERLCFFKQQRQHMGSQRIVIAQNVHPLTQSGRRFFAQLRTFRGNCGKKPLEQNRLIAHRLERGQTETLCDGSELFKINLRCRSDPNAFQQGICRGKELPPPEIFSSPALARIYSVLKSKFENGEIISMASMSAVLLPQEAALLASVLQKPEALRNGDKALADYIERIRSRHELKQSGEDLRKLANRLKETKGYEG